MKISFAFWVIVVLGAVFLAGCQSTDDRAYWSGVAGVVGRTK